MKSCEKCRCNKVCGLKEEYDKHYKEANDMYDTGSDTFEVTIRCNEYIPERKVKRFDTKWRRRTKEENHRQAD